MSHFAHIEALFRDLFDATDSGLSSSERSEVQHFIDVGEYGLALETAVDILLDENRSVPSKARSLLAELANSMSMDIGKSLSALESRVIKGR